jgi:hypothetical protein
LPIFLLFLCFSLQRFFADHFVVLFFFFLPFQVRFVATAIRRTSPTSNHATAVVCPSPN